MRLRPLITIYVLNDFLAPSFCYFLYCTFADGRVDIFEKTWPSIAFYNAGRRQYFLFPLFTYRSNSFYAPQHHIFRHRRIVLLSSTTKLTAILHVSMKSLGTVQENDYDRYMNNRKWKPLGRGSKVEHLIQCSTRNTPTLSRLLSNREFAKRSRSIFNRVVLDSGEWFIFAQSTAGYQVVRDGMIVPLSPRRESQASFTAWRNSLDFFSFCLQGKCPHQTLKHTWLQSLMRAPTVCGDSLVPSCSYFDVTPAWLFLLWREASLVTSSFFHGQNTSYVNQQYICYPTK